jgi:hypothetical protein
MNDKLLTAQDILKNAGSYVSAGFNMGVMGHTIGDINNCNSRHNYFAGFMKAEEMIRDGKIFYTHRFKCKCGGQPFIYGGFWVCNGCGGKGVDKKWWSIKVQKDGNTWCCTGLGFVNLQESENYAFGGTRQEAIDEYEKLMKSREA